MKFPRIGNRTGRLATILLALMLLLPILGVAGSVAFADEPAPPPTQVPGDVKVAPDIKALEQGLQSKELPQQKSQNPNGKEPDQVYTCRDSYEIDDTPWYYTSQLRTIAMGDIQQHNFCPSNDRDVMRVNLTAGNTYRVRTFDLGTRADTFVGIYTMNLQRLTYDDDSGSAHSDGRYASWVTFQVPSTGSYYIVVWNLFYYGYGVNTDYKITVNQIEGGGGLGGGVLAPSIRVDQGCGASYRLGAYIGIYFTTNTNGPVQISMTSSASTVILYSNSYLPADNYLLQGNVGNPLGTHTYTISNTQGSATCSITVTSTQGGGGVLAPSIRVDQGCGASYRLGAYIGIYFTTNTNGPVQISMTSSASTAILYSNSYLPAGYYLLQGNVGNPLGTHTYTISNTQGSATCGITVTSTGYTMPQQEQSDALQNGATVLPLELDVQP
ncbi:MAG: hypothetical protein EXR62_04800 [Chloroflexi bacterium]|nr:hypothetical protein [Chloroflexota bacterium]